MKDKLLIGIFCLLVVIAGMLSLVLYNQYVRYIYLEGPLSLENLKKSEGEYWQRLEDRYQAGKISQEKIDLARSQYEKGLARADVSQFFDPNVPLDQPNIPHVYVATWVALAVSDTMTMGFSNYKQRLSLASDYFTDSGWYKFLESLERQRTIKFLTENRHVLDSVVKGPPILESSGIVNGRFQWIYQVPLAMSFQSGSGTQNKGQLVTVVVVRTNDYKHPYGIAIDQWVSVPR